MKYEGEKFLSKLYNDMHLNPSVMHSSNVNDKKLEKIKKYLDRQERVHEKAVEHNKLELLKKAYYDKYIIKQIPKEYIEFLYKISFDEAGHHLIESIIKEHERVIIEEKKQSLDNWIDYLTSDDARFYPWWAKYWAFQGMLKIGAYDSENDMYGKRDEKTVAPFIELNREILAKSIDLAIKQSKNDEHIEEDLKELISSGSFTKLYIALLKKQKKIQYNNKDIEGIWIKYEQGDNYKPLLNSLQGYNTGWCTVGEATCKEQIENGDFYVYYTKDINNEYKIPRLAIRMDGKDIIGEIRGIAKGQNVEPHLEEVLDRKLNNFQGKDAYKNRINDSKMLTYIYTKYEHQKELTREDLRFIYEIDRKIESLGYYSDPRVDKIKEGRNSKKDMAIVFECKEEEEVALTKEELEKSKNIEVYIGDLDYSDVTNAETIKIPKIILGDVFFQQLTTAKGLENLQIIGGDAYFNKLENAKGLENLYIIKGDAHFDKLTSAKGLENLHTIGRDARFKLLTTAKGLENLQTIGGSAIFYELESVKGLENLKTIGCYAYFENLTSAKGLKSLHQIGEDARFDNLISAKGLENLQTIGGDAYFDNLISAKGLENLRSIGRGAHFFNLTSSEGLDNLQTIGGNAFFENLITAKGLENLQTIGRNAIFGELESAKGLDNLQKIGENARFDNLISTEGLENFEEIGENIIFIKKYR